MASAEISSLPPPPEGFVTPASTHASLSVSPLHFTFAPAGRSFEYLMHLTSSPSADDFPDHDDTYEDDAPTEDQSAQSSAPRVHPDLLDHHDMYQLLGLSTERFRATPDDIKTGYRRMILLYHPDKNPDVTDDLFKAISKAFDTLSNPQKRRVYDSSEPFDDTIPSETLTKQVYEGKVN
eukprot:TRINITY_DN459_c2_g1_i4.p1 TRINITY_DN459_c2_g1~~TRINITY_DN459_c2_g1_i4.p1  ORF type:complete len:201 (+),score=52.71 TRINITY_DN459_c2_g1_i4:67-603(+)